MFDFLKSKKATPQTTPQTIPQTAIDSNRLPDYDKYGRPNYGTYSNARIHHECFHEFTCWSEPFSSAIWHDKENATVLEYIPTVKQQRQCNNCKLIETRLVRTGTVEEIDDDTDTTVGPDAD